MASKTATQVNDAYFTPEATAKWCVDVLSKRLNLKGKSALEPACGSGVFVRASEGTGLVWTTNELFPANAQGFVHDFNTDFAKENLSTYGTFDLVLTNPPFGHSSMLARKFLKRSFEIANTVAMILPKGCRRETVFDKDVPQDWKILVNEDLPDPYFELPDGTRRKVGCVFLVFQKVPGYKRGYFIDPEPVGYRGESGGQVWPEWATHGVGCLHTAGKYFGRERPKGCLETYWVQLSDEQEAAVSQIDWKGLIQRTQTSIPRLVQGEVRTAINKALRNEGLPPTE